MPQTIADLPDNHPLTLSAARYETDCVRLLGHLWHAVALAEELRATAHEVPVGVRASGPHGEGPICTFEDAESLEALLAILPRLTVATRRTALTLEGALPAALQAEAAAARWNRTRD